ncbi:MAG: hypothetical protein GY939_24615 [Actinomycetia bacterium]|nr:hypothetical protein [Actinomycetes bacterium]
MGEPRTLDEIRETILAMPFAAAMQLDIEQAANGVGVVAMPLADSVSFNGRAFAGIAVAAVADVAAGAAAFSVIPREQMAFTGTVETTITASTEGSRVSASAQLRGRDGDEMVLDAAVRVQRTDGTWRECGSATITLHLLD